MEPHLVARWGEWFNAQSKVSRNVDCISATQFYMSALIVMSVQNVETSFSSLWKYRFPFSNYWINCKYIQFHPLCTAWAIVIVLILFQTLLSFNKLSCHRPQSLSEGCTASAIWAGSETPLGACCKWLSLGICCEFAAVPCMPSRNS